jgi:hypothetical protein
MVSIFGDKLTDFWKLVSHVKGYLEYFITSLALNISNDIKDLIMQKIIKIMDGRFAISSP